MNDAKVTIERELELIDGMIEVQLHHAEQCDHIANRTMAEKQKGWDMERVALLRKMRAALEAQPAEPCMDTVLRNAARRSATIVDRGRLVQPVEPDMRHPKIQALIGQNARQHIWMMLVEQLVEDPNFETTAMDMEYWDTLHDKLKEKLTAAPTAMPLTDEMDKVASRYAHKMALDLECILAEYGGSWYNTAMQTLGEYRSAMEAIHERESPTFMGEPVIAAAGDKS